MNLLDGEGMHRELSTVSVDSSVGTSGVNGTASGDSSFMQRKPEPVPISWAGIGEA